MIKVGLTGGIGSGKSTVARILKVLGIPVFEADAAGRRLLEQDPVVRKAIRVRFGEVIFPDGQVDRSALAGIVFHDPAALRDLNAIIHPAVRAMFHQWAAEQHAPYTVMEAAILTETEGYKAFDRIIVVSAPEEIRIQRVMRRDSVEESAVRARLAHQASEEERLRTADHVIHNDDRQLVIPQVLAIHDELLNAARA